MMILLQDGFEIRTERELLDSIVKLELSQDGAPMRCLHMNRPGISRTLRDPLYALGIAGS
jgi:hypothetical protein